MRLREILAVLATTLCTLAAPPRTRIFGTCAQGNQTVSTQGYTSTTKVERSYPSCTVTVYLAGTSNIASIYSDDAGTAKANPFTAASDGYFFFYADDGTYDVRLSDGGIAVPFTRGDYALFDRRYQRSEAGGTTRTVKSRLQEVISVKDFGATGDGSTDDAPAIQAAIDAAAAASQRILVTFPPGQYRLGSGLTVSKPMVHLRCDGQCELLLNTGVNGITISPNPEETADHETIQNSVVGLFIKPYTGATPGNGITVDTYGTSPTAVVPVRILIAENKIWDMGGHGIYVTDEATHTAAAHDIVISRNDIRRSAGDGIRLDQGGDNIAIDHTNIDSNTGWGIYAHVVAGSANTTIHQCRITRNATGEIRLVNAPLTKITENEFEQGTSITGANSALLDIGIGGGIDANQTVVRNNNLNGSTSGATHCVRLDKATGVMVEGNLFSNCTNAVTTTANAAGLQSRGNVYSVGVTTGVNAGDQVYMRWFDNASGTPIFRIPAGDSTTFYEAWSTGGAESALQWRVGAAGEIIIETKRTGAPQVVEIWHGGAKRTILTATGVSIGTGANPAARLDVATNAGGDTLTGRFENTTNDSATFIELVGRDGAGTRKAGQITTTTTGGVGISAAGTPGTLNTSFSVYVNPTNGQVGINTVATGYNLHVYRSDDGDVAGFQDATGTCTVNPNTTALICPSDGRMKKNVTTLEERDALARVLALRGVSFNWRSSAEPTRRVGFVAQEAEKVIPEAIHQQADGTKAMAQTALIPYLVQAIKAQQAEIEELKAKLAP